eukprot:473187_1
MNKHKMRTYASVSTNGDDYIKPNISNRKSNDNTFAIHSTTSSMSGFVDVAYDKPNNKYETSLTTHYSNTHHSMDDFVDIAYNNFDQQQQTQLPSQHNNLNNHIFCAFKNVQDIVLTQSKCTIDSDMTEWNNNNNNRNKLPITSLSKMAISEQVPIDVETHTGEENKENSQRKISNNLEIRT